MRVFVEPAARIKGKLTAPADKSISHRAAILAAMADEPVLITNYLEAADTLSTLEAITQLGALVERRSEGLMIRGTGLRNAQVPKAAIDVGNAGTLIRLLPGWLAGQQGSSFELDGDASIRRRPIDRIAEPLRLMGAEISATEKCFAPFTVDGRKLTGIDYLLPVASAQVKSCICLAALIAEGPTTITEPQPSRDHTERLLAGAGVKISRERDQITIFPTDEMSLPDQIISLIVWTGIPRRQHRLGAHMRHLIDLHADGNAHGQRRAVWPHQTQLLNQALNEREDFSRLRGQHKHRTTGCKDV